MRFVRSLLVLSLLLSGIVISPQTALAVDPQPPTGPELIKSTDFNSGALPSWMTRRSNPNPFYGVGNRYIWGFENRSRRGTTGYGLWCSQWDTVTNYASFNYPTYGYDTSGQVIVSIPELADYYSSSIDYYYLMPSVGASDGSAFNMQWGPLGSTPDLSTWTSSIHYNTVSAWTYKTHSLNEKSLSRVAGEVRVEFNNHLEGAGSPTEGQGATIDDFAIRGYMFGPVASLAATSVPTGIQLSWVRPRNAMGSATAESRTISYRVWRKAQTALPEDPWTELTLSGRLADSATSFTDTTVPAAGTYYRYMVVPYGSGADAARYGSTTEVLGVRAALPPAPVMTALASSSHPVGVWGKASSVALAWAATGTDITGYGLTFDQSPSTAVSTQNTTATSGTGTATTSGTWYAHVAAKDGANQWSSTRHLAVLVDLDKPVATDDVAAGGYEGTATVTLSATDAHSGVKAIDYTIGAGAPVHTLGSSASFSISTPGTYTVNYTAEDNAGNTSVAKQATVWVRAVPPPAAPVVTSLTSSSHPVGVWGKNSSVALAWTATGTGITGYGLLFDQNPSTTVSTQNTIATSGTGTATTSGTWYAHVAAKDATQMGATRNLAVLVDLDKPVATDDAAAGGYEGTATVTLSATDAHSGVKAIDYTIGAGAPVHTLGSSASFSISTPGTYTVNYTAEDNAGNTSDAKQATVWVRAVPPLGRSVALAMIAAPDVVAAGQPTDLAYTITNTGDVAISGIELARGATVVAGPLGPLAAHQSTTVHETYTAQAGAGHVVLNASVTGDASGTQVTANASAGLQVYTPAMSVSVSPATRGVSAGKRSAYQVTVTNTGDVALDLSGLLKIGTTESALSESSVAAGSSATLFGSVPTPTSLGDKSVTFQVDGVCGAGTGWVDSIRVASSASTTVVKDRFYGASRTETAVKLSAAAFPSADSVVIATAYGYADALSASALAASVGGPLLLVRADGVPAEVMTEIARLGATKAYVIGGTSVVGTLPRQQLTGAGLTVIPVSGTSRYATAAEVAKRVDADPTASKTVFLATGTNFPDALAASSLAAAMKAPILLTKPTELPAETLAELKTYKPTRVVVCGGTGAVSDAVRTTVMTQLSLSSAAVPRLAGTSRYATAKLIIDWGRDAAGLAPAGIDGMYIASGANYPDALAGGVFAASYMGRWRPLMLTNPVDSAPVPEIQAIVSENPLLGYVSAIGGAAALPQPIYTTALGYIP